MWQWWCVLGQMTLLPYFSSSTAAGCAGLGASSAFPGVDRAILPRCPVARALHICAFILLRQCQQLPGVSLVNVCCATCQEAAKMFPSAHTSAQTIQKGTTGALLNPNSSLRKKHPRRVAQLHSTEMGALTREKQGKNCQQHQLNYAFLITAT